MSGKFAGKVAWVTGGNSGIGFATAKAFANEGARVVVTGRDPKTLEAARLELGEEHLVLRADAANLDDTARAVAEIKKRYGRLDALFVNAGIAQFVPFAETTEALFDQTIGINVKGAYFTAQKALELFGKEGGAIVFTASVAAHEGLPGASVYGASKAALLALTHVLASELAPRKIRVNSVSPGPITTPIFDRMGLPADAKAGFVETTTAKLPLARFGEPSEVASAVLFLSSAESSYVTGTELTVDGGLRVGG
jgi:NAD(P)-dependent dehydrogenase (short-subunit alcohol dehydrogenase family)